MNIPPLIIPAPRRVHRKRRDVTDTSPPGVALTLIGANYEQEISLLSLQFDRPINIAAFDGSQITLLDGVFHGQSFEGITPAGLSDPTMIAISLTQTGIYEFANIIMSATALTGIVAVDDGGTWEGVTDLELPYPPVEPNHIAGVNYGGPANEVVVSVNSPVSAIDEISTAFQFSPGEGAWMSPVSVDITDPLNVIFTFGEDVSLFTEWQVLSPGNWDFVNGLPLGEPHSGTMA